MSRSVLRQAQSDASATARERTATPKPHVPRPPWIEAERVQAGPSRPHNRTGLPDRLRAGVEALSGLLMDDVRVHRNSLEPARLGALAYAQGGDIHLGPGQEHHLAHEAWHVVQQKQGRVRATATARGPRINDDEALEREAERMGSDAVGLGRTSVAPKLGQAPSPASTATVQRVKKKLGISYAESEDEARALMTAYAKKIGHAPSTTELDAAVSVAANSELGIDQGERILHQHLLDAQAAAKRKERRDASQANYDALADYFEADGICAKALSASFDRYVANPSQPNIGISGTYTTEEATAAVEEWKNMNGTEGVKFWAHPPQDKAAAGKGNVGATLALRQVQANLLIKWGGTTINVHVDVVDLAPD